MQTTTTLPVPMLLDLGEEWGEDESGGGGWLLSYIDILSLFLALLVVLLGYHAAAPQKSVEVVATETGAIAIQAPTPAPLPLAPPPSALELLAAEELLTRLQPKHPDPSRFDSILAAVKQPTPMSESPVTRTSNTHVAVSARTEPPVESPPPDTARAGRPAHLASAMERHFPELVKAAYDEHGVSLEIADAVLFASGHAQLTEQAKPLLAHLAQTLREAGEAQLAVQGHTDDRPVRGGPFESNWELSAARATAVTRFLIGHGLAPSRVRAIGFADTRPLAENSTAEGRARNRRVNLIVEFTDSRPAPAPRD